MKTSDFTYHLPPERIAQVPIEPRHDSRLLVLHRDTGELEHTLFREIGRHLQPGDLLVINRTRVIPGRIFARKPGGGRVELLLLRREDETTWEALAGGRRVVAGVRLQLEEGGPQAEVLEVLDGPRRRVRFSQPLEPYLQRAGQMPLPPYIHTRLQDPGRYQTVYAQTPGSAAAPTAGLHFTPWLMEQLQARGIRFADVTLHVGLDTFAPVTEDDPRRHPIHSEWCELPPGTAEAVAQARRAGRRVVAVGTTTVRTLETAAQLAAAGGLAGDAGRPVQAFSAPTRLFILPGHAFRAVDALVTNFHLPRSTLLMLVSALAGRERILQAYEEAVRLQYRFYSFGDAMLIL